MEKKDFIKVNRKINSKNVLLNLLTNNLAFVIFKSWLAQGFIDLSIEEKLYKIILNLFIIGFLFSFMPVTFVNIIFVLLIAQTVNWITNDHFMDNMCHLNLIKNNNTKMFHDLLLLKTKLSRFSFIDFAGVYGRIARGESIHTGSDIDIRIIRKPGFFNAVKSAFVGHYLRTLAIFCLIPIDLQMWNKASDLNRMRKDENPLMLIGTKAFIEQLSVKQFRIQKEFKSLDIRSANGK